MKKNFFIILSLGILTLSLTSCSNNEEKNNINTENSVTISEEVNTEVSTENSKETITEKDFSKFFENINGTAVFYNPSNDNFDVYNTELYDLQASPCSSFKIISTLIGLEKGLLQDESTKLGYDGTNYSREEINKDLTLEEAFKLSAVWYYKKFINEISPEDMQEELNYLNYGNKDISEWDGGDINPLPQLNGFWLESSLKISPKEQTQVLYKIFGQDNKYSDRSKEILKNIMLVYDEDNLKIYGKTGAGYEDNSWFVGMVENSKDTYYFAVKLSDPNNQEATSPKAREIAIEIIKNNYK